MKNEGSANRKSLRAEYNGWGSLEEVPEAWGSTGKSKEKVSFGAEKSDVPSKNRRKLDSKWENGKGNRR